ncbi:MAG: hypothetical protein B7733_16375 [Myxococcales bacterium FL481]|nr:MAG: hypothetical protein B7733_16375 [Myxococcales bacterium FL481]
MASEQALVDERQPRRRLVALVVGTFAFYLLTGSRERPWGDAQVMWEVAVALIERHAIDIAFEWPPMSHRGADGLVYAQYPILPSLAQVPGATAHAWLSEWWPRHRGLWWPVCSHLAPALAGAWTVAMTDRLGRRLGASPRAAMITAAVTATATGLWVYARYSYSEALQAACYSTLLWHGLQLHRYNRHRDAIGLGLWLGLAFNTKPVFAVAGFALAPLLAWWAWRADGPTTRRARCRNLVVASLALAPFVALFAIYNAARWGNPLTTGYEDTLAYIAGESPWFGAWGLLASPGKSVFLYSPPLVAAAVGWVWQWRTARTDSAFVLLPTLAVMFTYTRYLNWSGGWCFGPRYWLFATPVLMLGFATAVDRLWAQPRRAQMVPACVLSTCVAAGVAVQILGNLFYWDHFIRIAKAARTDWLGDPDRSGSKLPARGRGHCDSCFEDMYPLLWLPAFQPIEGHLWLARSLAAEHDWQQAEAHAPWTRYTDKTLDIRRTYRRARLDWWGMIGLDRKRSRGTAVGVGAMWFVMLGSAVWLGRSSGRSTRRTNPSPPSERGDAPRDDT